jgi:YD repeat-containing protein
MTKHRHSFYHHLGVSSAACASDLLWRTTLDATGRRTARHDADGARLAWGYDPFDQLTSAARTNSPNGAADAAYRYQYQYDLVGNRLREKRGPEADPLGRQLTLYGSHNNLNQLTTRDWSGKLPLHGAVADPDTILLVQGVTNAPPYWNGTNWLAGASLTSGSNNVDIVSVLGTGSNRTDLTLFMPPQQAPGLPVRPQRQSSQRRLPRLHLGRGEPPGRHRDHPRRHRRRPARPP